MGTPSSNPTPSLLLQIRESVSTLNAALTQWTQSASGSPSHSQASTSGARAATSRPLPPPAARAQVGVGVPVTSMAGGRRGRGQGLPSTYSRPRSTPRSSAGAGQTQLQHDQVGYYLFILLTNCLGLLIMPSLQPQLDQTHKFGEPKINNSKVLGLDLIGSNC